MPVASFMRRCRRGDVGHPDQRIGQQEVALAAWQAAVGRIRIGRLVAARDDGVFDRPGEFEARGLGRLQQFDRSRRINVAAGVAVTKAEFHDGVAPWGDAPPYPRVKCPGASLPRFAGEGTSATSRHTPISR